MVLPLLWQHPNSLLSRPVPPKGRRLSQGLLIVLLWLLGLPLQELRRLLRQPLQSGQSSSQRPQTPPTLEECRCFWASTLSSVALASHKVQGGCGRRRTLSGQAPARQQPPQLVSSPEKFLPQARSKPEPFLKADEAAVHPWWLPSPPPDSLPCSVGAWGLGARRLLVPSSGSTAFSRGWWQGCFPSSTLAG